MATGKKKLAASTVLLNNARSLVNFITPDANGHIPAGDSPELAFATIGVRARQILTMARKVCKKPAATKGCERVAASR